AQAGGDFKLRQPQKEISVTAGETLTLNCTVSEMGPVGPVKWLKGWGSGSEIIYDQRGSSPRVTRAVDKSNTDFTILISDVRREDAGTYYCVKFRKAEVNDKLFQHGNGTVVSVQDLVSPFPNVKVAAAVLCFLLLVFILAFCMYRRKQRGEGQSQHAAGAPAGSCLPISVPCCAGSPSSEVQDAETPRLPHQQSSEVHKDIHYADLQPLPAARRPGGSPGAERSEYASIRGAAK
ncbi:SHPS1 phosphatase, partial [Anseranas semipalmata]|nr:SHPS1 phosphatase [Anseranas semipalmata]